MRRVIRSVFIASISFAVACTGSPVKPDAASVPGSHVDVAYTQFIVTDANKAGTEPVNISGLPLVRQECGGLAVQHGEVPPGGGLGILATLATSLIGKAVTALVTDLKNWVNKEAASYATSASAKASRDPFYSSANWYTKAKDSARYSCFAIIETKCQKATGDTTSCDKADARIVIIGQYRLTSEYLQSRTLYGAVGGFGATRNQDALKAATPEKPAASIVATLKFSSTWWDGREGHVETPITAEVLSSKFNPSDDASPTPVPLKVLVDKDAQGNPTVANWEDQPLIARPPQSPGSEGTVDVIATIAEANPIPGDIKLLQKVLGDNSADIATALKSAITKANPNL
jgi:hypothetical protein